MTLAQLGVLDSTQASAVTDDQFNSLDASKRQLVTEARDVYTTDNGEQGGSGE